MKRTRLKPKSDKQIERDKVWIALGDERLKEQVEQRGYTFCEDCNLYGERNTDNPWRRLDYHHKDRNRRNNVKDNLKVLHQAPCHAKYHGLGRVDVS